ncbi:MAG: tetratricopeptide repeat protein [Candidatus Dadabacteria bacterium]|nr:MAG: tetratricopeptide repeat protein [Candidatus Dadabacteria bacterium]
MKLKHYILVFSVGALVFCGSLFNGFVLDDVVHITKNYQLRTVTNNAFRHIMLLPYYPGNLYRPLIYLSYYSTYTIFGLDPLPHHAINILLHALNCVLVLYILSAFLESFPALIGAVSFALLPIHTEAVANVSGRGELLYSFFSLSFLSLMVDWGKRADIKPIKSLLLLFPLALMGFLSKESCVVLFFLSPLTVWAIYKKKERLQVIVLSLMPLLAAFAIYLIFRIKALGGIITGIDSIPFLDNPLVGLSPLKRALYGFILLGRYAELSIAPHTLSGDYSYRAIDPNNIILLSGYGRYGIFAVCLLCIALMKPLQKNWAFFSLWFFLAFIPTSNIFFPIGTVFGERLAYLPSVGICAILGIVLSKTGKAKLPLSIALCMAYGTLSYTCSKYWRHNYDLIKRWITVSPESAKTQCNYGFMMKNQGNLNKAVEHFDKAISIYTNYADPWYGKGLVAMIKGDLKKAAHFYKKALAVNPQHAPSLTALGDIAISNGEAQTARRYYKAALIINPNSLYAKIGLIYVNLKSGDISAARETLNEILKLEPKNPRVIDLKRRLRHLSTGSKRTGQP